nr:hypothetical protein [uncultured Hyphomonas sp.]
MKKLMFIVTAMVYASTASAQWYAGGTLHRATGKQWVVASNADRLATSSDFVAKAFGEKKVRSLGSINKLKPYAQNVKSCVDETYRAPNSQNLRVSEIAASCLIILGYY